MKKIAIIFLMVTLVVTMGFLGIGCKAEEAVETTAAPAEEEDLITKEPVTISFWTIAGPQNDMWQGFKKLYEAKHPNVTIEITPTEAAAYYDMIPSALASGQEKLDFLFHAGGTQIDTWAKEGLLLDLTNYAEENNWYDQMYGGAQDYIVHGLGTYWLSTDYIISPLYFYNKSIFKEVGVTPPTTLDELLTISEKIRGAGYEPLAMGSVWAAQANHTFSQLLARFLTDEDAKKFTFYQREMSAENAEIFKSEGVIKALDYLKELSEKSFCEGFSSLDMGQARQVFIDEKAAMWGFGTWEIGLVRDGNPNLDFDYFLMPPYNGKDSMVASFCNGVTVPANVSKEKIPVIVDIINNVLSNKEYATVGFQNGNISSSKSMSPEEIAELVDPLMVKAISDIGKYNSIDIAGVWFSGTLLTAYNDALVGLVNGSLSSEEASQMMYDAAIEILEQ